MKGSIKILDANLINKIAAGEVVERPASVVKELLENSIDAGSTRIELRIENGGIQLIQVSDNGSGMNEADAKLAFVAHATSKINNIEDLERIMSMGFRGEALASIASVSNSTLHTYTGKDSPVIVESKNGTISTSKGEGRSQGTTVTVRNIFSNIPARRKFLKSEQTEYKYLLDTFYNIVVPHFRIGFKLSRDNKTVYDLQPVATAAERIRGLFPALRDKELITIDYSKKDYGINAMLGHPETASTTAVPQYTFINNRYVNDKLITKAVREGFVSTVSRDSKPLYFIFLTIEPKLIDVNVHPRKLEVKFLQPGAIFQELRTAVSSTLENTLKKQLLGNFRRQESKTDFEPQEVNPLTVSEHTGSFLGEGFSGANITPIRQPGEITFKEQNLTFIDFNFLQIFNTYLVFEQAGKLLVVDQHAADERVKFDSLQKHFLAGDISVQPLLVPEIIRLSEKERIKALNNKENLARIGFKLGMEGQAVSIKKRQAILNGRDFMKSFNEIFDDLPLSREELSIKSPSLEKIFATIACHSSFRAGRRLEREEGVRLIADLFRCKLPYSCPHGRPIIWEVSRSELEKNFKRRK